MTLREPDEQQTIRVWRIESASGANHIAVSTPGAGLIRIRNLGFGSIAIERNQLVALADLLRDLAKETEGES